MLIFKKGSHGADVSGITPEMVIAIMIAHDVFKLFYQDLIINENRTKRAGVHMVGSKHDTSNAIDITTTHVPNSIASEIFEKIKKNIPDGYDVILESTHIHIERDPKEKPYNAKSE